MKYKILDIGKFIETDAEGYLINQNTVEQIQSPFDSPIPKIIEAYKNIFNQKIHSIYIRGSVARNQAILGFSDYDCFAVLNENVTEVEKFNIKINCKTLKAQFSFVSNFDLFFFNITDLFENKDFKHWQFAIKIQSICIYGKSLSKILPRFKPNSEITFLLSSLEKRIHKSKQILFTVFDPSVTLQGCSWIMRTFVRCGFELVIERERKYTNELSLCCKVFSTYYPEKIPQMNTTLELAVNPITNLAIIIDLIEDLGDWLVAERRLIFGE